MGDYIECPLHWLVCTDNFYCQFEARLTDPNARDTLGFTLLQVAAQSPVENSRIVKLLLDRGADVESATQNGHTPLHFAVTSRNLKTVVALIENGANVNSKDISARTPLHLSICNGESSLPNFAVDLDCDMTIVERLLRHPEMNVNPVDGRGDTPLMWAVKERNSNAVSALLKRGANPNISNKDQRTPLHEVFSSRNPDCGIVISLLTNGAGIYCVDNSQKSPMDIFIRNGWPHSFSALCVRIIALRYHIRDCLKHKLKRLSGYLEDCCKEVRLMRKVIIYRNVTLHDFALGCFQMNVRNPELRIFKPVVEILLSGLINIYFEVILDHISESDLFRVLEKIAGRFSETLESCGAANRTIFQEIGYFYDKNVRLKKRLLKYKHFMT